MITISKIPDGKNWADAIAQYRSKGMRTNFYAAAEEFLPQLQWLSELKFDGGCYLFHEKEKQIDLYFFLEQGRKAEQIPVFDKPVLLEQVGVTKAPPDLAEWEEIGFVRYLQRKRLFLSARNVEKTERVPSFAKEEEAETILALMQQSFEPYTSALPDLDPAAGYPRKPCACGKGGGEASWFSALRQRKEGIRPLADCGCAGRQRKGHWKRSGAGLACHRER